MTNLDALKTAYRILSWVSLAGLALVIILVLRKSPEPQMLVDPEAAARVEKKFAAADQAKAAGQPAQVQMDRTELNSFLAQNLDLRGSEPSQEAARQTSPATTLGNGMATPPDSGLRADAVRAGADQPSLEQVQSTVKDVKIDMEGDLVKAYVVFDFHGKDLSLELDGHLGSQDGYVKFEPVSGKLGSLPLPQSTLDSAVEKMLSSPENREKLRLPPDISDIQIVNGQAVVSYK
jgi:hypothetical protein